MRILVADGLSEFGKAIVRAFRSVDMKVAFMAGDSEKGKQFAQESGSRFCPGADQAAITASLSKAWGGIDLVVIESDKVPRIALTAPQDPLPTILTINPADFPDETPASLAQATLLLTHPTLQLLR